MDFKGPYLQTMRVKDPGLFMELRRSNRLDQFVQQKSMEAHQMLQDLLQAKGSDLASRREAEEEVMAVFLDFPVPEKDQRPEPPDDLKRHPTLT